MSFAAFQIALAATLALLVLLPLAGCWVLCRRASVPGWAALLVLIPIVNLAAVYRFASRRCRRAS